MSNLNKNIKIFFLDLDGTLLDIKLDNGKHWISNSNVEAIAKIQKEGKHVVISTGRFGNDLQAFMKRVGVQYAVIGNGSQVIDNKGKVYKDDKLTLQQSLLIFDFVKKNKLSIKLDGMSESFGPNGYLAKKISTKFGFFPNGHYNMPMHKKYSKIVIWGKAKYKIWKMKDYLSKTIPHLSIVTSSRGWTLEVTNEKSTKGLGNKFLAEKFFKITNKNEMAHLGDTLNDSTVVDYMTLIAMGTATKKLKKMADYIGVSYKNGGVGEIITKGQYKKTT